jgi:cellobiose phosphorylase
LTQVLGIRGQWGDLLLAPKLVPEQFGKSGQVVAQLDFAGKRLKVTYFNRARKPYGKYKIESVLLHGRSMPAPAEASSKVLIRRADLQAISAPEIDITLSLA